MIPHFLDSRLTHDVSLTSRKRFTHQEDWKVGWLEGLGILKKSNDLIGKRFLQPSGSGDRFGNGLGH